MAIVDVRNIRVAEGNFGSSQAQFTLFLDGPATAPVEVDYFIQGVTATEGQRDLFDRTGTARFDVGESTIRVGATVLGDRNVEGDETFDLVVVARQNATLADGAAALKATATIMDDDDSQSDPSAGDTTLAERLYGPEPEPGVFPTIDVRNVNVLEGQNSRSEVAFFLVSLDRPATALVEGNYFVQAETASQNYGDYFDRQGSYSIAAGEQSTWVSVTVRGDAEDELDESFQLVLTTPSNAVFPGNAPAITARATIIDDDGPRTVFTEAIGDFGEKLDGPAELSSVLPTIRVNDINVREGNSGNENVRFLVTLDKPAPIDVTVNYTFNNGSATEALGDYDQRNGTLKIDAGKQSAWLNTTVRGDNLIEGDEQFSLVLSIPTNAVFEENAVMLEARATIIDDDGGTLSGSSGVGAPARGIEGPAQGAGVRIDAVSTSIIEGNSSFDQAYVYVLLSEPAIGPVTMEYQTIDGTASRTDRDFTSISGTLRMVEGQSGSWVGVSVLGDNSIEGDETFALRFSNPTGAVFANGQNTLDATITIKDNDTGTITNAQSTGPQFDYQSFFPGTTSGDDTITGTAGNDIIDARAGDDLINAGSGGDRVLGSDGNDTINGGDGGDWLQPGGGSATVDGGNGNDMLSFADLLDTPGRTNVQYRLDLDLTAGTATTSGSDVYTISNVERVTGSIFADRIKGDAGDNQLRGLGDYDWFTATTGADTIDGGTGQDMISYVDWLSDAVNTADTFNPGGAPPPNGEVTGVVVDLNDTSNNTNLAAGHEYISVERVTGSGRQDVFYGDENENDFRGLGDFDWFVGSTGGRERYFGGDGGDTVTYYNSTSGVSASLRNGAKVGGEETGRGTAGDAALDLYFSIENLVGTNFADNLTGNEQRNNLNGLSGDDFIFGYGGIDVMKGGKGNDVINGGAGSDYALFDGNKADTQLFRTAANEVRSSGAEGFDIHTDVEYFRFSDGDVSIWELAVV